jgi:hypothetical protein
VARADQSGPAGFYTHNWVERLLQSGIPDVHKLHPEWKHLAAGDLVRTNRERRPGHPIGWSVVLVEPNHAQVLRSLGGPAATYAYVLASKGRRDVTGGNVACVAM